VLIALIGDTDTKYQSKAKVKTRSLLEALELHPPKNKKTTKKKFQSTFASACLSITCSCSAMR
jgi:hypothetical protein